MVLADDSECRVPTLRSAAKGRTPAQPHCLRASTYDLDRIEALGLAAYIDEQLNPKAIVESPTLLELENSLFTEVIPSREDTLIAAGQYWRYVKGTSETGTAWTSFRFSDADWLIGPTGFGIGDGDDQTVLADLRPVSDDPDTPQDESRHGYLSVYLRHSFQLSAASLAEIDTLILSVDYDDGFKAYLKRHRDRPAQSSRRLRDIRSSGHGQP